MKSTQFALENRAVETLLISDHLFRAKNSEVRKEYVKLAEDAERKNGIKVVIFSSMTQAGQRLKDLTGVAAVLHYPLPGIDDIEEDSDNSSDNNAGDQSSEEEKASGPSFDDDQLDLLMNEGMIGYDGSDNE